MKSYKQTSVYGVQWEWNPTISALIHVFIGWKGEEQAGVAIRATPASAWKKRVVGGLWCVQKHMKDGDFVYDAYPLAGMQAEKRSGERDAVTPQRAGKGLHAQDCEGSVLVDNPQQKGK